MEPDCWSKRKLGAIGLAFGIFNGRERLDNSKGRLSTCNSTYLKVYGCVVRMCKNVTDLVSSKCGHFEYNNVNVFLQKKRFHLSG